MTEKFPDKDFRTQEKEIQRKKKYKKNNKTKTNTINSSDGV
jgi:hypothetical protein